MPDRFGARLKELRRQAGITQQALAESAELSVSGIARLEQGGQPKPATVAALARALGVPVELLNALVEKGSVVADGTNDDRGGLTGE